MGDSCEAVTHPRRSQGGLVTPSQCDKEGVVEQGARGGPGVMGYGGESGRMQSSQCSPPTHAWPGRRFSESGPSNRLDSQGGPSPKVCGSPANFGCPECRPCIASKGGPRMPQESHKTPGFQAEKLVVPDRRDRHSRPGQGRGRLACSPEEPSRRFRQGGRCGDSWLVRPVARRGPWLSQTSAACRTAIPGWRTWPAR